MLAFLATSGGTSAVEFPWRHPDVGAMPEKLQVRLDLARRFSLVFHGAALLYNLMLSEMTSHDHTSVWTKRYRKALQDWGSGTEAGDLRRFDQSELWEFLADSQVNLKAPTRHFVTNWVARLTEVVAGGMADDPNARALVKHRERELKKGRSRFTNQRALEQWAGASGSSRMYYRRPIVQSLLNDLQAGLERKED